MFFNDKKNIRLKNHGSHVVTPKFRLHLHMVNGKLNYPSLLYQFSVKQMTSGMPESENLDKINLSQGNKVTITSHLNLWK